MISSPAPDADALLAYAERGGPGASLAARRAASIWEQTDPDKARRAMALAMQLAPLEPAPRLGLARLAAESGDLHTAAAAAREALAQAKDAVEQARAAFMLAEIARGAGDLAEARAFYERTLKLTDSKLLRERGDPEASRWFARARGRLAEFDASAREFARAKSGAEGALALLRAIAAQVGEAPELAADIADAELRLGALELDSNQPASARRRFSEAVGRYEALAITEKQEPHWRAVLSDAWALAAEADYARGAPDSAREAMGKSLQVRLQLAAKNPDERWALAGTWRVRAALHSALGDHDVAAESMQQARTIAETLVAADPRAEGPAHFLVHTLLDQADHALRAGARQIALDAANQARGHAEKFAARKDASASWLAEAAAGWDRIGEVARGAGGSSSDAFARAVEFRRMAHEHAPDTPQHTRALAAALLKQGDAELEAKNNATARTAFAESATIRLKVAQAAPKERGALHALAVALERLGLAAKAHGDLAAARQAWEDELALAFRLFERDNIEGERFCAIVEAHLAQAGGPNAETYLRSALARFDTLARAGVITEREAALRKSLWGG